MALDPDNETDESRRHLACTIFDMVGELLYYGRKEDNELPVGKIESMIADGDITVDEMVELFKDTLKGAIK